MAMGGEDGAKAKAKAKEEEEREEGLQGDEMKQKQQQQQQQQQPEEGVRGKEELPPPQQQQGMPPDRPGWTAAWSEKHQAWYWWNNLMQTTWDDPVVGEPRIVPSRLVKQPVQGAAGTTQGVTQQQVDALPHVHSQLGDLNMLTLKALRNICTRRDLATRGRRVDLVCRLIAHDVAQCASSSGSAWQTTGHARLGQRVCLPRAKPSPEARDQANPNDATPSAASRPDASAPPSANESAASSAGASAASSPDASAASSAGESAASSARPNPKAEASATVRGIVTAWKPAGKDVAMQFYVVLQDGSEEVLSDPDVEDAAAATQSPNADKTGKVGRARHGERARAREVLEQTRLGKWSNDEIAKLDEALKDVGHEDWHTLSQRVGTRSHLQVYDFQRRRIETAKKRRQSEDNASLELLIEQYMTDHSLTKFDKDSVGITATHVPESVVNWLTSAYGEDEAASLATRIRKFFYPPVKTEAETPGQAGGDGNAEDSTEDAGDGAGGTSSKRSRNSAMGLPWTAFEERQLEKLVKQDGQSPTTRWGEKARVLGTRRSGNSVHQRWKLIQLGGGVLQGEGTVSRSWPTGTPTFEPASTESSSNSTGGASALETELVDVNCYKIDAGKEYEIRITAETPPRFSVYDLVRIVCNLGVQDIVETEEKHLLFARVPDMARCASRRNRSHSWLATKWRYVDRIIAFCAAIRDEAYAVEAGKFRSTSAFMTIEKLITALEQQGPSHPVARALQLHTGGSQDDAEVNRIGAVPSLPNEAEFRKDLKRMCRDRTLVGQRLSIYWGGDQSWYSGKVFGCRKGKEFKVVYDDGETSWESADMQIGVRFLDAKPTAAPKQVSAKERRSIYPSAEEIQEWKVLTFINSEPYEPSDIRLTGEKPPRIALRDFLECVLDVETGSEHKQKQVVKQLRRNMKKSAVQEYIFVDERGQEDQTEVVALTALGKIFPLLPSNLTNRVRETGDLHRLQKMLRQETGIAGIEMSVEAPGPGPVLQGLQASRGGRGAGKAGKETTQVNLKDWQETWSPVLCLPSDDTRDRVAAAARDSDPYVDPAPASLRLESRQLMTQASGRSSLPGATSRHPGHIRLPSAPTAELRWLCTTGNLTGRRVSVYWPKDDLWYDGTVDQCQPGRFKLTYDSNVTESAADTEPAVVRWEVLGIGVHLLTQLPVGETMRKMFATRSRMVNGRGRPVHTAPRLKHRQSASIACYSSAPSLGAPNAMEDESELDPIALTSMLMAPSFRVEGDWNSVKTAPGNTAAASTNHNRRSKAGNEEHEKGGDTSAWTPKEEALLRQVVISMGTGRWEAKAAAMNTKRSWMALALRYGSMIRRQKNDPLLKKGFRLFSASPSTQELKAARAAIGIATACEACGVTTDGSYGTGRFCSQSCKNKYSARVKNENNKTTGAAPSKPTKRFRPSSSPDAEDDGHSDDRNESGESGQHEHEDGQCEQCGRDLVPPLYGNGRFCGQLCGARFSTKTQKTVRDKRNGFRDTDSSIEDEEDEDSEDEDSEDEDSEDEDSEDEDSEQESNDDDADRGGRQCQTCHRNLAPPFFGKGRFCDSKCAGRFSRSPATKTQTYGSRSSSRPDRRLPKRQRIAPKPFVAGPAKQGVSGDA